MGKMPILETARGAFNVVFYNLASLIKAGAIPLSLMVVVDILSAIAVSLMAGFGTNMAGGMQGGASMGAGMAILGVVNLVVSIALFIAMVAFSTAWIRFTLSVADGVMPRLGLRWGRPEWLYLGYGVAYAIASVVVVLVLVTPLTFIALFLAPVIGLVASLAVMYLVLRLGFVFPAVAMGEESNPVLSWKQTADGHLHLFAIVILCVLPFMVAGLILGILGGFMPILVVGILIALIKAALSFLGLAVAVAALSLCYRGMTGFRVR